MVANDSDYTDLGAGYFLTRVDPGRRDRRVVIQLHQLGVPAALSPRR